VLLKTLGHPALRRADGTLAGGLRRKDLALLVYLCVEGLPAHARGRLAALLWGESPEERARHSLTQALGRLARVLDPGIMVPDKDAVRWAGGLPCDAVTLLREGMEPEEVDDAFSLYPGPFLEGFDAGPGAEDFHEWADRRRAELRNAALRLLERAGEEAEAAGAWARALRLGERAVEIDPVWEQGHRRVMRALAARGERNGALRYYQRLEAWLAEEVDGEPDPDTRALAEQLRAPEPSEPRPAVPDPVPVPIAEPAADAETGAPRDAGPPLPPVPLAPPPPRTPPDEPGPPHPPAASDPRGGEADPLPHAAVAAPAPAQAGEAGACPPVDAVRGRPGSDRRSVALWLSLLILGALLTLTMAIARERARSEPAEHPPAHGESVRLRGTHRIFLAFGETLYEVPDSATLCACTGWYPDMVRQIRALPPWPQRMLPSVMDYSWIGGNVPLVSDDPADTTVFVAAGCIRPSVPNRETLDSIFGSGANAKPLTVPDSVLSRLPQGFIARGHPLRPAGTLIRGPQNRVRWITYHGGALEVTDPSLLATHCRSVEEATTVDEREFDYYRPWGTLGRGAGGCPRSPPPGHGH
jgi:DNA-binding SARP family transcriptional activator